MSIENEEKRADIIADLVENYMESFDNKIFRSILENGWVGIFDWTDEELLEQYTLLSWMPTKKEEEWSIGFTNTGLSWMPTKEEEE